MVYVIAALVVIGLGLVAYSSIYVQPRAVRLWAEGLGCEVVAKDEKALPRLVMAMPLRPEFLARHAPFDGVISNTQQLLRLTLRDADGRLFPCWVLVGHFWLSFSTETCPIRVRWDGPKPGSTAPKKVDEVAHPLHDGAIDG